MIPNINTQGTYATVPSWDDAKIIIAYDDKDHDAPYQFFALLDWLPNNMQKDLRLNDPEAIYAFGYINRDEVVLGEGSVHVKVFAKNHVLKGAVRWVEVVGYIDGELVFKHLLTK